MANVDDLKKIMDEQRDRVEQSIDDIEDEVRARKAALELELAEIKESLGETIDDAKKEIHGFVNKIKANIKPILIGVALFAAGVFTGSLSSVL